MRLTMGVDFGGSSSKVTVLTETGEVLVSGSMEYKSTSLHAGWLEQDVNELADVMMANIRACLEKGNIDSRDIKAVALDAATHMAILCDENDKPIRPMIHWSDSRSTKQAKYLKENYKELIEKHCVNAMTSSWTIAHLLWLKENEPEALEKTRRIYFGKDYFRHLLTGDFVTDYIDVIGTMMADDHTGEWIPELCEACGVSVDVLPPILNPGDIAGHITADAAEKSGLCEGTPVLVGTTDTVMEVFSTGAIHVGQATIKLATAGRICPITDKEVDNPQFYNYKHVVPGLWYPGTATRSCAASYTWFRNNFGDAESMLAREAGTSAYELMNEKAEQVPPGSDGVMFHPYLLGEMSPYADDALCASFVGVRMNHKKGHFVRAVMEGVSYSMRDCMETIKDQGIEMNTLFAIGGGVKGKLWRQILSDVLQKELICIKEADSSLGSAMLAAVSIGIFKDLDECVDTCKRTTILVTPNPENKEVYDKGFAKYKRYQQVLAEVYHEE